MDELLTPEELAIAVNLGVDKYIDWVKSNPDELDTTYTSMREQCIVESVAEAQLAKVRQLRDELLGGIPVKQKRMDRPDREKDTDKMLEGIMGEAIELSRNDYSEEVLRDRLYSLKQRLLPQILALLDICEK